MAKNAQTTAQLHSSHASKVMLKIFQARLEQYVNCELPDVQAGFRKGRGEKERYLNLKFQGIERRDKKAFLSDQCKEIEETIEWESLEISSRKLEIPREHFMQRWAQ